MKKYDIVAYLAIVFIQSATLPAFINTLQGLAHIPPLMPAMLAIGMLMLLCHSLHYKMQVYIVANSIGVLFNVGLLVVSL